VPEPRVEPVAGAAVALGAAGAVEVVVVADGATGVGNAAEPGVEAEPRMYASISE
jgi:hypothetical protein